MLIATLHIVAIHGIADATIEGRFRTKNLDGVTFKNDVLGNILVLLIDNAETIEVSLTNLSGVECQGRRGNVELYRDIVILKRGLYWDEATEVLATS